MSFNKKKKIKINNTKNIFSFDYEEDDQTNPFMEQSSSDKKMRMKQAPNVISFIDTEGDQETNDKRSYDANELAGLRNDQQYSTKQNFNLNNNSTQRNTFEGLVFSGADAEKLDALQKNQQVDNLGVSHISKYDDIEGMKTELKRKKELESALMIDENYNANDIMKNINANDNNNNDIDINMTFNNARDTVTGNSITKEDILLAKSWESERIRQALPQSSSSSHYFSRFVVTNERDSIFPTDNDESDGDMIKTAIEYQEKVINDLQQELDSDERRVSSLKSELLMFDDDISQRTNINGEETNAIDTQMANSTSRSRMKANEKPQVLESKLRSLERSMLTVEEVKLQLKGIVGALRTITDALASITTEEIRVWHELVDRIVITRTALDESKVLLLALDWECDVGLYVQRGPRFKEWSLLIGDTSNHSGMQSQYNREEPMDIDIGEEDKEKNNNSMEIEEVDSFGRLLSSEDKSIRDIQRRTDFENDLIKYDIASNYSYPNGLDLEAHNEIDTLSVSLERLRHSVKASILSGEDLCRVLLQLQVTIPEQFDRAFIAVSTEPLLEVVIRMDLALRNPWVVDSEEEDDVGNTNDTEGRKKCWLCNRPWWKNLIDYDQQRISNLSLISTNASTISYSLLSRVVELFVVPWLSERVFILDARQTSQQKSCLKLLTEIASVMRFPTKVPNSSNMEDLGEDEDDRSSEEKKKNTNTSLRNVLQQLIEKIMRHLEDCRRSFCFVKSMSRKKTSNRNHYSDNDNDNDNTTLNIEMQKEDLKIQQLITKIHKLV